MAGIGPVIGAVEVEEDEMELEGNDAPEPNSSGEGSRLTGNPVLVLVMYAPRRRTGVAYIYTYNKYRLPTKTVYISYTQSLPLSLMPTPLYDAPPRKVVIPTVSPPSTTFEPSSITIHPTANAFADSHGRTIFLRGINVSGDAKYPMENPVAGTPEFYDTSTVTYVGKPFPSVDQASEWWTRLRAWGIGIVRMVITWEALEPRKMGEYDEKYIDYIYAILERAHQAGLMVFIDGHQDVWSRYTGGSGAPMWTFHMVGLDPSTFPATCAAALDVAGVSTSHSTPSGRLWPTNYSKFGPATMFTVFYAGEVYAPKAVYSGDIPEFQGENIGYVLRSAYIKAYAHLASRLSSLPNVLGYDPMNEPHPGYIALPSLHRHNENTELHLGHMPSALQSMELAAGLPTPIGYFERTWPHPSKRVRDDILNKERISAWLPGRKDIWLEEGVYILPEDKENGKVTLGPRGESYFATNPNTGRKADFEKDFYVPFLRSFKLGIAHALQDSLAGRWMFVEPVPNLGPPAWAKGTNPPPGEKICYSPHWYDIRVLYEKALWYGVSFDTLSLAGGSRKLWKHTYIGRNGLTANYADNFQRFISHLKTFRPEKPTPILIGETGIPFDMNLQSSYITGDIHIPLTQLDAIFHGMEKSLLNWTVWNLTLSHSTTATPESTPADNETSAPIQSGDNWNSEDFSLVSLHANPTVEVPLYGTSISPRDLEKPLSRATLFGDLYLGGRLLPALLRPYPVKTAGIVINSEFFLDTLSFELRFIANPPLPPLHEAGLETTTEIFVPVYHFSGRECILTISVSGLGPEEETTIHKPHVNGRAKSGIEWTWDEAEQDLAIVHDERHAGKEVSVALRALVPGEVAAEKKNWAGALVGMFV